MSLSEGLKLSLPTNDSSGRSSEIYFGEGLALKFSEKIDRSRYSKCLIVADESLARNAARALDSKFSDGAEVVSVGPGESAKTLSTIERLWRSFSSAGLDRRSVIIGFGGGSTLDAAGFAASTYMRGIRFINVPTTLLAQTDGSIGGKTGINLIGLKNLIGTFADPDAVVIDPLSLKTLPRADFAAGMAEILKHAAIKDARLFGLLETLSLDSLINPHTLLPILFRSCEIKAGIVAEDPREKHLRRLLNFGHTLGHIAEAQALKLNKPLRHGEAVALGMIGESRISKELGLSSEDDLSRLKNIVLAFELPTLSPVRITAAELEAGILKDKKTIDETPKWPLLRGIGASALDAAVPQEVARIGAKEIGLI